MTRTDLIEAIAQETGTDKQQAKTFLEGFTRLVEREMKNEGDVPLAGLRWADTPRAVAEASDVVFTMVTHSAAPHNRARKRISTVLVRCRVKWTR